VDWTGHVYLRLHSVLRVGSAVCYAICSRNSVLHVSLCYVIRLPWICLCQTAVFYVPCWVKLCYVVRLCYVVGLIGHGFSSVLRNLLQK